MTTRSAAEPIEPGEKQMAENESHKQAAIRGADAVDAIEAAVQIETYDEATQILTLGAATVSKTLTVGGEYEINAINCTVFGHTVDAVTDANKRIIRQIGDHRRFTAKAATYYFWTEDGAALTAYLVRRA